MPCIVRVRWDYGNNHRTVYYRVMWWAERFFQQGGIVCPAVTHWMPFPTIEGEELGEAGKGEPYLI